MRKSHIAVRTSRAAFSYEIPQGRKFLLDSSIEEASPRQDASTLQRIIRIGVGGITLKTVEDGLNTAFDKIQDFANNVTDSNPARQYLAGNKVRPYVFKGAMNLAGFTSIKTSDRASDIKSYALLYLNAVVSKIEANSFFAQQLTPGQKPHYRCVTSNEIVDNVIAQSHIHSHLNNSDKSVPGVDYRLVLQSGAIIDFVISTDDSMKGKMMGYPIIPGSVDSDLNGFRHYDAGGITGSYQYNNKNAVSNRKFSSQRSLSIMSNPIGFLIEISIASISSATYIN